MNDIKTWADRLDLLENKDVLATHAVIDCLKAEVAELRAALHKSQEDSDKWQSMAYQGELGVSQSERDDSTPGDPTGWLTGNGDYVPADRTARNARDYGWLPLFTHPPAQADSTPGDADARRLDWLDSMNAQANKRNGTVYGWKFDINHNRASLSDHNLPALSVRAAIDAAMINAAPKGAP